MRHISGMLCRMMVMLVILGFLFLLQPLVDSIVPPKKGGIVMDNTDSVKPDYWGQFYTPTRSYVYDVCDVYDCQERQ